MILASGAAAPGTSRVDPSPIAVPHLEARPLGDHLREPPVDHRFPQLELRHPVADEAPERSARS